MFAKQYNRWCSPKLRGQTIESLFLERAEKVQDERSIMDIGFGILIECALKRFTSLLDQGPEPPLRIITDTSNKSKHPSLMTEDESLTCKEIQDVSIELRSHGSITELISLSTSNQGNDVYVIIQIIC